MSKQKEPKKLGRPDDYDPALANEICDLMSQGKSLLRIIKQNPDRMPDRTTVYRWLRKYDEFRHNYALARELQADHYFDEGFEIVDDGTNDTYVDEHGNTRTDHDVVHRSKLRVEYRKWVCARMAPWKYSEKVEAQEKESFELPTPVYETELKLDEPLK